MSRAKINIKTVVLLSTLFALLTLSSGRMKAQETERYAPNVLEAFRIMPDTLLPYFSPENRQLVTSMSLGWNLYKAETVFGMKLDSVWLADKQNVKYHLKMSVAPDVCYEWLVKPSNYRWRIAHGMSAVHPDSIHEEGMPLDTLFLIQTVCAPICVSVVSAYTMNWRFLKMIEPPFVADLYSAHVAGDSLVFVDQTPLLLDEEERKHYQIKE